MSSRQNPLVQHIRRLGADAAYRRKTGLFVVEGPTLLHEALSARWIPAMITFTNETYLPDLPDSVQRILCTESVMDVMSPSQAPPGLLCVLPLPEISPSVWEQGRYLFLDRVQDPGNVGSLLRSARAFGIQGMCYTSDCADPFAPKVLRAAMGATFHLPLWRTDDPEAFLSAQSLPLLAAVPGETAQDIRRTDLSRGVFVLGNEAAGIRPSLLSLCASAVRIPMTEQSESLGVAAAAAILLWEAFRGAEKDKG